jgi:hypothetical protein
VSGLVRRDERERLIDAEAERLVAAVLSFGILVLVLVRSLRGEASWDLLALVIAGGVVGMAYRARRGAIDRRFAALQGAAMVVAAIGAAVVVALLVR